MDDGLTLRRFFLNLLFFCLCSEEEDVLVKERVAHREREGRASGVLERFYYVFFFFFLNIVLTWTIVGAPKASVLYVYIDKYNYYKFGKYSTSSDQFNHYLCNNI